jgi:hypothetical protein
MTPNEYAAKYDRLARRAMKLVGSPVPERRRTCEKNCGRGRYIYGGCHAFVFRPADEGECWGWTDKPDWEVR